MPNERPTTNARRPTPPCLLWLIAIGLACAHVQRSTAASQATPQTLDRVSLFTTPIPTTLAADGMRSVPSGFPPAVRSRSVELSPLAVPREGLKLELGLFADAVYTAQVDRVTGTTQDTLTIRGRIEGYPLGTVILTTSGGRTLGVVDIPELQKRFSIQNKAEGETYYLIDVDLDRVDSLEGGPSLIPPAPLAGSSPAVSYPQADPLDCVTADVMIVYTPAARTWADASGGGLSNVIAQAMAKGQLALDNSETFLTLRLVHSAETAYTETGTNSGTDLSRLRGASDGYMDEIHTLRDQYRADLVALFVVCSDVGGVGYLLESTTGDPAYAFCLNRVQQAASSFTVIHEMGHNMGCHHAKAQNTQPGPGLFTYSAGWRWTGSNSSHYCSIMTYEAGTYFADGISHTRVAYFSSPALRHLGALTGDAADADNARTLRESKGLIAMYRSMPPTNDNFADSAPLSGNSGAVAQNNGVATVESGEPAHYGRGPYKSVWYSFTPAFNGALVIDTHGSAFDTVLAIYTGSSVDSLVPVASNDDDGSAGNNSGLTAVALTAGTPYRIAVAGYYDTSCGAFTLNWTFTPICTLTVVSAHGGARPGTLTTNGNTALSLSITNSPVASGATTQYVCLAATVTGNTFTQVSPTQVTLTLTNDATITWQWQTQYRLTTATNGNGSVTPAGGWYAAGSSNVISATPGMFNHFVRWTGTVASTQNPLTLYLDKPYALTVVFGENLTTNAVPVPEWWLAEHGLTNREWTTEALDDQDHDRLTTWQEWVADTDPTNPASTLALEGLQLDGSPARIAWRGGILATQYLERTPGLGADIQWVTVFTNRPPTAASTNVLAPEGLNPTLYYRIRAGR